MLNLFSLCSEEVILPTVQSMMFSEDSLKHPAVEYCSPSEAAPGESTTYLLYTLLYQHRMTRGVTKFMNVLFMTMCV